MSELKALESAPKQIRKWACHKLECFTDYIEAYTGALKNTDCYYMQLFAGCGNCICKGTDCCIEDSELRAIRTRTKFAKYIFVTEDSQDADSLRQLIEPYNSDSNIEVRTGNIISEKIIRQLFNLIPRSASTFTFIEPSGYRKMRWSTIKKLIAYGSDWRSHKIELLIIFPLEMALLRNLTRPECEASITRLYGNRKWQDIKQAKLDGEIGLAEVRNRLVELFKDGLKNLGYKYVESLEPAKFSEPSLYHVISASDSGSRIKLLEDAWCKPRYLPCELLYDSERF